MPFLYEFYLNKTKLTGIEIGFSTSRKWEEALDEAKLSIPFYNSDVPFSQYGLLEIEIQEVDNYTDLNEIATKTFAMLVVSDRVSLTSQYSVYRHDISAVEYTAKLDAYIMSSLAKTRSIENKLPAKFEITTDGGIINHAIQISAKAIDFYANAILPPFTVKQTYYVNKVYTFSQIAQAYQIVADSMDGGYGAPYMRVPTIFRVYNETTNTYSQWYDLSADDVDIIFTTKGKYQIEYGLDAFLWATDMQALGYTAQEYAIYRFYFSVIDEYQVTIYDLIESVRQNVSKGGGIESQVYYDDTRIFELDSTIVDYLKSIPAPQMYLEKATARQMLIFVLSYINSLPRLEYGSGLDTLKIEQFNLTVGDFEEEDTFERSSSQNANQIGTKSFAPLNQVLPNDMDEATLFSPSQDGFQQVRATDLQITDSTFAIKLQKEIYTPKQLEVLLPTLAIQAFRLNESSILINDDLFLENQAIPITTRLINIEEWKLKFITDNFPTITTKAFWDSDLGLRANMVDNLYWELGSKKIEISDVYGTLVNQTLIQNVIKLGLAEHYMLNMFTPFTYVYATEDYMYKKHSINFDLDFLTDISDYKDLRFRFSYLTLENLITKNDKEDLTQIDFYSEMRQNQDESIINVVRSSRKNYGDLQRTGNKAFSFQKFHYSLSELYDVGLKDINGYTITTRNDQYFAYYILSNYFVTKHYNRESRQTIVDQTYRWRDNYAKSALNRHENYQDYLIIYPPNYSGRTVQTTKISSNDTVKTIFSLLLGETITDYKTKATVALVRTDGMYEVDPETTGNYHSLMIPVSSYPIKQGFAFTFGFDGNQVAGDGLIQAGVNWYNRAVRYTDEQGRFTRLGFTILKGLELDSNDYETHPKITKTSLSDLRSNLNPYFSCGFISINQAGFDSLVIDKDPMTNYNQTYQVNVLSSVVGLYIIGQAFYNNNFIVNNPETEKEAYLYLYTTAMKYELFEDLKVKSGYTTPIKLDPTKILYDNTQNKVYFTGLISLVGVTAWAIGDIEENLYIACNSNYNGFLINKEHFRSGVREIGYKNIYYYQTVVDAEIGASLELLYVAHILINHAEPIFEYELETIAVGHVVKVFRTTQSLSAELALSAESRKFFVGHASITNQFDVEIAAVGHVIKTFRVDGVLDLDINILEDSRKVTYFHVDGAISTMTSLAETSGKVTATPIITFISRNVFGAGTYNHLFTVQNKDSMVAEIFADTNATPTNSRGMVDPEETINVSIISSAESLTVYTRALVPGNNYSATVNATSTGPIE